MWWLFSWKSGHYTFYRVLSRAANLVTHCSTRFQIMLRHVTVGSWYTDARPVDVALCLVPVRARARARARARRRFQSASTSVYRGLCALRSVRTTTHVSCASVILHLIISPYRNSVYACHTERAAQILVRVPGALDGPAMWPWAGLLLSCLGSP